MYHIHSTILYPTGESHIIASTVSATCKLTWESNFYNMVYFEPQEPKTESIGLSCRWKLHHNKLSAYTPGSISLKCCSYRI